MKYIKKWGGGGDNFTVARKLRGGGGGMVKNLFPGRYVLLQS